jgi:hypothetical protein
MTIEQTNMELMQTLDDAWNSQDWDTFEKRHKPDTIVRWPAQLPTRGVGPHRTESAQYFKTFPDNHIDNRPYKTFEVDFCAVAGWDNGQIVEENLFYDLVGMMQQLGIK